MPPRRRAQPGAAPAPLAPAPDGVAPFNLVAMLRAWWAWSWESKAMSSTLVALSMLVAAVLLQPSESTLVQRALTSQSHVAMPQLARFVERREMSAVINAIEVGENYIVVDGGNRVGKSVAVEVAASRLSGTRTVRWSVCDEGDTAAVQLRRLFGLDAVTTSLSRVIAGITKLSPPVPPSVSDIRGMVLAASASGRREPVLVVEMAERLEVKELKTLLDFAKELVDKRRGRFIFVFSPTEKLDAIGDFGSLSRAEVVHVGALSKAEATAFLSNSGCDAEQASALYALVGGHLPHLVAQTVGDYCRGTASLAAVEDVLVADIVAQVEAVDRELGVGSGCGGLCGVTAKAWPKPAVLDALVKKHLVLAALKKGVFVESQMVRAFVHARCACNQ